MVATFYSNSMVVLRECKTRWIEIQIESVEPAAFVTGIKIKAKAFWSKNLTVERLWSLKKNPSILEKKCYLPPLFPFTLESWIDVGQGITVGPGKFAKKNKRRALNKSRAWTKCANLCNKKPIKLENICRPWEKFQNLINVGPLIRL